MIPERGFVTEYEAELKAAAEQQKLKERYNIDGAETVVIEKTNMIKFFVNLIIALIHTAVNIMVVLLGTVGIITLAYPDIRNEFIKQFCKMAEEIMAVAGFGG